jgi:hypothetical protein
MHSRGYFQSFRMFNMNDLAQSDYGQLVLQLAR